MTLPRLDRSVAKRCSLDEEGCNDQVLGKRPEQCLNMVWPLTVSSWSLLDPSVVNSRLQRHVVRAARLKD